MDEQIVIRGVDETQVQALRDHAQERLDKTLERFQSGIVSTTMRLEDVTGPDKKGVDKLCAIEVHLRSGDVRIRELSDDFHVSIGNALDRLKAALSREVSRNKRGVGEG